MPCAGRPGRLIEASIDRLPETFRTVFVLRAVEEFSVEETAAALAIPPATGPQPLLPRPGDAARGARARGRLPASTGAFGFAGDRCDRIVADVLARLDGAARHSRLSDLSPDQLKPGRPANRHCRDPARPSHSAPARRSAARGQQSAITIGAPPCPAPRPSQHPKPHRSRGPDAAGSDSGAGLAVRTPRPAASFDAASLRPAALGDCRGPAVGNQRARQRRRRGRRGGRAASSTPRSAPSSKRSPPTRSAPESGLLQKPVLDLAVTFQGHHKEHAELLAKTIAQARRQAGRGEGEVRRSRPTR